MIRNDFNNCLDCWKSWEDNNSNNSFHLGELSNALLRINTCVSDSSEMFRSYLFEPFTLLYGVVLQRSAELTEKNLKNFVAIIGQPSSLSSTAKPVDTDKADDEQTTMNNCCSFIDSWDAFSHLRSTMILARLSALAKLQFETVRIMSYKSSV